MRTLRTDVVVDNGSLRRALGFEVRFPVSVYRPLPAAEGAE